MFDKPPSAGILIASLLTPAWAGPNPAAAFDSNDFKGQSSACSWSALGAGTNDQVKALVSHDDGSGPAVFAGGSFTSAGGNAASRIAKWDGMGWSEVGGGVDGFINALAVYDDGSGPALYAGGVFTTAGGVPANRIAKWDGAAWSALGIGLDGSVAALAVYDDGGGEALFAGGFFTSAGGDSANRIAKWDGTNWSRLGQGVCCMTIPGFPPTVQALAVHDDGGGEALFAAGWFNFAGQGSAASVAKWDGLQWSTLGGGLPSIPGSNVRAMAAFDDGDGAALYAGGGFNVMFTGAPQDYLARWDGANWTAVGGGPDNGVSALTVHDDGSGAALYAGGNLTAVGGVTANRIARWNGIRWEALGSGVDSIAQALATHHDGTTPSLYVGGTFGSAGGLPASFVARWSCSYIFVNGFEQ